MSDTDVPIKVVNIWRRISAVWTLNVFWVVTRAVEYAAPSSEVRGALWSFVLYAMLPSQVAIVVACVGGRIFTVGALYRLLTRMNPFVFVTIAGRCRNVATEAAHKSPYDRSSASRKWNQRRWHGLRRVTAVLSVVISPM